MLNIDPLKRQFLLMQGYSAFQKFYYSHFAFSSERKYQCLGQWTENDVVYAYTKRLDVGTYECFVGAMTPENKIFLKEAGENCQRNVNPYRFGMEIHQTCKSTFSAFST